MEEHENLKKSWDMPSCPGLSAARWLTDREGHPVEDSFRAGKRADDAKLTLSPLRLLGTLIS